MKDSSEFCPDDFHPFIPSLNMYEFSRSVSALFLVRKDDSEA